MFDLKKEVEEGASLVAGVLYKGGEEIGRWLNGVLHIHGVGQFQPHEILTPTPSTVTDPQGPRTLAPVPEGSLAKPQPIPAAPPAAAIPPAPDPVAEPEPAPAAEPVEGEEHHDVASLLSGL